MARFAATRLATASAPISAADQSFAAGEAIGRQLAGEGLRGVHVLSDGLLVNGSELVRGLSSVLPAGVVVTGGLAGDGDRFVRTWVLHDGAPSSGHVTAVGFYGERVAIGHGSAGGWDPFGPRRLVTRSKGNILYELDGKPALELYKQYLGDRADGLPATGLLFPLALSRPDSGGEDRRVVRTILAVDEAAQSLTFAGDIPTGAHAQLMKAQLDRLIEGAEQAATLARPGAASDALAIAISCVGRRLVLRDRSDEEVEAVQEALPAGAHEVVDEGGHGEGEEGGDEAELGGGDAGEAEPGEAGGPHDVEAGLAGQRAAGEAGADEGAAGCGDEFGLEGEAAEDGGAGVDGAAGGEVLAHTKAAAGPLGEELAVAAAARGEAGDQLDVGVGLDAGEHLGGRELDVVGELSRELTERGHGAGRAGHRVSAERSREPGSGGRGAAWWCSRWRR